MLIPRSEVWLARKKLSNQHSVKASGAGEGMYWKYESVLKKLDSDLYSVVGAAGELFSLKTSLFYEAPRKYHYRRFRTVDEDLYAGICNQI